MKYKRLKIAKIFLKMKSKTGRLTLILNERGISVRIDIDLEQMKTQRNRHTQRVDRMRTWEKTAVYTPRERPRKTSSP